MDKEISPFDGIMPDNDPNGGGGVTEVHVGTSDLFDRLLTPEGSTLRTKRLVIHGTGNNGGHATVTVEPGVFDLQVRVTEDEPDDE